MRAKAVVVSLFLALLVGASGALALDSQTAPPDYTPVPQEATEGVTSTPVATVLLVQDLLPWGSSANTDALTALGVSHVVINSADLAATDLSEVHVVMYASDQPTTYYQNIAAEIGKITDFVSAGGVLLAHACDRGWNRGTWDGLEILPGGAHHVSRADNALQIVQALHPVVAGLSDADLSGWGSSTHGYLTDL
nr:hypothetical protein [Gemmatimonadales bacterium]NIR00304.1 hypothetical protein [Gemmatimonadales bacterium]